MPEWLQVELLAIAHYESAARYLTGNKTAVVSSWSGTQEQTRINFRNEAKRVIDNHRPEHQPATAI